MRESTPHPHRGHHCSDEQLTDGKAKPRGRPRADGDVVYIESLRIELRTKGADTLLERRGSRVERRIALLAQRRVGAVETPHHGEGIAQRRRIVGERRRRFQQRGQSRTNGLQPLSVFGRVEVERDRSQPLAHDIGERADLHIRRDERLHIDGLAHLHQHTGARALLAFEQQPDGHDANAAHPELLCSVHCHAREPRTERRKRGIVVTFSLGKHDDGRPLREGLRHRIETRRVARRIRYCLAARLRLVGRPSQRDHASASEKTRHEWVRKDRRLRGEPDLPRQTGAHYERVDQRIGMIDGKEYWPVAGHALESRGGDAPIVPAQRHLHDGLEELVDHARLRLLRPGGYQRPRRAPCVRLRRCSPA